MEDLNWFFFPDMELKYTTQGVKTIIKKKKTECLILSLRYSQTYHIRMYKPDSVDE